MTSTNCNWHNWSAVRFDSPLSPQYFQTKYLMLKYHQVRIPWTKPNMMGFPLKSNGHWLFQADNPYFLSQNHLMYFPRLSQKCRWLVIDEIKLSLDGIKVAKQMYCVKLHGQGWMYSSKSWNWKVYWFFPKVVIISKTGQVTEEVSLTSVCIIWCNKFVKSSC